MWQKIASVFAKICFVAAFLGVVVTLVYGSEVTAEIKAAMGAISFFCFALAIVLKALGGTSIPNLNPVRLRK